MVIDDLQEVLMADYLRIPHMVLKMQQVLKNPSAYGCLQFIWYKTGGWNKGRDTISYSQFKNDKVHGLGVSTKTIKRGLEILIEKKLIHATPSFNSMNEYSLNLETIRAFADGKGVTICHTHNEQRGDNLSIGGDILSIGGDNLSSEGGQSVTHNRYSTIDTNTTDTNTTDSAVVTETEATETKTENTKPPAKKKPAKAKTSVTKFNPSEMILPDYVDTKLWAGYHQMRADIKKDATEYACQLMIDDLVGWHEKGLDVNASLKTSIIRKWVGLFEPKERLQQSNTQFTQYRTTADPLAVNDAWGIDAPMTDEERRIYLNLPPADNDDYGQPAFDFSNQGVVQL